MELATAIAACDVPRVKALLPRATYQNLNDLRGNTTLFLFALERGSGGPASPERLEMVRALIEARGFVGYPQGRALEAMGTAGWAGAGAGGDVADVSGARGRGEWTNGRSERRG